MEKNSLLWNKRQEVKIAFILQVAEQLEAVHNQAVRVAKPWCFPQTTLSTSIPPPEHWNVAVSICALS